MLANFPFLVFTTACMFVFIFTLAQAHNIREREAVFEGKEAQRRRARSEVSAHQ